MWRYSLFPISRHPNVLYETDLNHFKRITIYSVLSLPSSATRTLIIKQLIRRSRHWFDGKQLTSFSRLQEAEEAKTEMIRSHINAYNILNIRALSRRPAAQWTVMAACPQYKNTYQLAA